MVGGKWVAAGHGCRAPPVGEFVISGWPLL
jgi:hypothetical protein